MAHALVLTCVLAAAAVAQEKPDFSGHWVLERPAVVPPNVANELIVGQWLEWQVSRLTDQSFPFEFITIEPRFAGDEVQMKRYQIGLSGGVVGGVDASGRGSGPNGRVPHTTFSTRWNGNRLAIDTGSYSGYSPAAGPYTEVLEEWSLDAENLVILMTTRSSTSDPMTVTLTYSRRRGR